MLTLEWIGKNKVVNHHQKVSFRVLERQYNFDEQGQHTENNDSENMIIHGDNLEALKALLPQYEGKVKCIYIVILTPILMSTLMTMPSVSISLAFGINWITLACTTSLKQNTGRDIHYERQTISEKSTARAPAEPFGGIGTCTIFDRHRDLPPSHFLYRFGLDCGCSLLSDGLFFHTKKTL